LAASTTLRWKYADRSDIFKWCVPRPCNSHVYTINWEVTYCIMPGQMMTQK
jgi:hypothetical protein